MEPERFITVLTRRGKRMLVLLPFDPAERWGTRERYHVRGTVNGVMVRGVLEPSEGQFAFALGPAWLRDSGLDEGDELTVELALEGIQVDEMAPDLSMALSSEPEAKAFFESLPTFYRNNYLRWIDSAKRPETRAKRIAETIRLLKKEKRER